MKGLIQTTCLTKTRIENHRITQIVSRTKITAISSKQINYTTEIGNIKKNL